MVRPLPTRRDERIVYAPKNSRVLIGTRGIDMESGAYLFAPTGGLNMRPTSLVLALTLGTASCAVAAEPFKMSLEEAKVGELPSGWVVAKTGRGPGSVWKVLEDPSAPGGKAIAQTSAEGPNSLFNLCVAENAKFDDVDLAVSFKAVAGRIDQGGGPVWRYKDADNYYVARMNPLEDNYRVYKVVRGKRLQLGSADVKAPAGQWHTLRIVHVANHIRCYLNGKVCLDVKDDTFKEPGKIGLWTKADAQTSFASLEAKEK